MKSGIQAYDLPIRLRVTQVFVPSYTTCKLASNTVSKVGVTRNISEHKSALNSTFMQLCNRNILISHIKSHIMHQYTLIKLIKARRETLKLSQESLAEISGVGLRTLKQFESGKGNPTLKTLEKLADVLGLEIKLEVKKLF